MFKIKNLDHIVLNVADIDAVLNFYINILGLKPDRVEEYKTGKVKFPSVRINDSTLIDLFPLSMHGISSTNRTNGDLNHFCLVIEKKDIQNFLKHLKSHHVFIESESSNNYGAQGTASSVYFRDPENRLIEVRYYD